MRPTGTRVVRVRVAEREGSSGPTQDRVFTTPNAVMVLDGASHPDPGERNGGWLAETLGNEVTLRLTRNAGEDLVDILGHSIQTVADTHGLEPGRSPSTTVSIVRWTMSSVDALVLGDSPVIVQTTDMRLHVIRDDRLEQIGARRTDAYFADRPEEWRRLVATQRAARNRPGGYWIAEAAPHAANYAVQQRWRRTYVASVLVVTDGVSAGVDDYGVPAGWAVALTMAARDPRELVNVVHEIEESDPDGHRWPRSKRHDDKVAAIVQFGMNM